MQENSALIAENVQLKISIENMSSQSLPDKQKNLKKMTQEFNGLLVGKDVQLAEIKQKLKAAEDELIPLSQTVYRLERTNERLNYVKSNLVVFIRYLLEKVNDSIKVHIFEMLDQVEAQTDLEDTFRCIIECMEECRVPSSDPD